MKKVCPGCMQAVTVVRTGGTMIWKTHHLVTSSGKKKCPYSETSKNL